MSKTDPFITDLLGKMSTEQKIGALLTLGFAGTMLRPHIYEYITKYHCGGLRLSPNTRTFGSYVDPKTGRNILDFTEAKGYKRGLEPPRLTADEYRSLLDELQDVARNRPLGLPLHFSFDQEGGTSADARFNGWRYFPKPMGLRAAGDSRLALEVARAVARQSRAVGFTWIHSPVLDINTDPANPEINTRAYSDRPEEVAEYAAQSCLGFKEGGLIATGKHFPGRGASKVDPHFEVPVIEVDKETLLRRELLPYRLLMEKNLLPSIMVCHSIFPALDPDRVATVSKKIVTGLLRDELGFDGVVVTDSMTMGGVAIKYGVAEACAMALAAGADLVLMKAENKLVGETFEAIRRSLAEGRISPRELDGKVERVLTLKRRYGLFNRDPWPETPEEVGRDESLTRLAETVAGRSVLIARDSRSVLPLSPEEKVLVIEQINKTPNDGQWHPGVLFKHCLRWNGNVSYLETAFTYDADDLARISAAVKDFETVVITNFHARDALANNGFLAELLKEGGRKYAIVTNTPYPELSIPPGADPLIITFATTPANMKVVADVLFGRAKAEGQWPIAYRLPD